MSLVKILSNTNQYSPKLAKKFGIESAAVFHYLIQYFGTNQIKNNDLEDLENDTGVNKSTLEVMIKSGLLIKAEDNISINKNHPFLQEEDVDEFELAMFSAMTKVNYTIFEDESFEELLQKWNKEVITPRYGKPFSKSELQIKFGDAPFNVSYAALEYSYKGKYVTINLDYARQRIEQGGDARFSKNFTGRFKDGRNKGNDGGGNSNRKTQDKPSSTFSERAIRAEE